MILCRPGSYQDEAIPSLENSYCLWRKIEESDPMLCFPDQSEGPGDAQHECNSHCFVEDAERPSLEGSGQQDIRLLLVCSLA